MALTRADHDTPWKDILEKYFQSFIELCHPIAFHAIDWSKGYESLDKELSILLKKSETGTRFVDKLIKVWCVDGSESWVLIHIEVQSSREAAFEERMYTYHYRLFDRYRKPIMSLAILLDDQIKWRPTTYTHSLWSCQLYFHFVMIKLLDYENKQAELTVSDNPFSMVILAHLAALNTNDNIQNRFSIKLKLTRMLYNRGWDKTSIINLYSFIDWVMALPEPLELEYYRTIENYEQEENMAYITSAERIGIQRGIEQGMQQGKQHGLQIALLHLLQNKFGQIPASYTQRIEHADTDELLSWINNAITAKSIETCF